MLYLSNSFHWNCDIAILIGIFIGIAIALASLVQKIIMRLPIKATSTNDEVENARIITKSWWLVIGIVLVFIISLLVIPDYWPLTSLILGVVFFLALLIAVFSTWFSYDKAKNLNRRR